MSEVFLTSHRAAAPRVTAPKATTVSNANAFAAGLFVKRPISPPANAAALLKFSSLGAHPPLKENAKPTPPAFASNLAAPATASAVAETRQGTMEERMEHWDRLQRMTLALDVLVARRFAVQRRGEMLDRLTAHVELLESRLPRLGLSDETTAAPSSGAALHSSGTAAPPAALAVQRVSSGGAAKALLPAAESLLTSEENLYNLDRYPKMCSLLSPVPLAGRGGLDPKRLAAAPRAVGPHDPAVRSLITEFGTAMQTQLRRHLKRLESICAKVDALDAKRAEEDLKRGLA